MAACVTEGLAGETCGVQTALLGVINVIFDPACQARDQPEVPGPSACPSVDLDLSSVFPEDSPLVFDGCCRAATATCGARVNEVHIKSANLDLDLGLGCVAAEPISGAVGMPC